MALSEDLVIETTSVVAGTSVVQINTSSERVVSFVLQADDGNSGDVYLGDSSVTANNSFTLDAKDSLSFNPIELNGRNPSKYDLNSFWVLGSAAAQRIKVLKIKLKKQT